MPWCPNCKLEYVDGVTICPDCKSVLVDSLSEESNQDNSSYDEDMYNEEVMSGIPVSAADFDPEELKAQVELINRIKEVKAQALYKPKTDRYEDNKSGAFVLLACGIIGAAVLILNALGVFKLPMTGFSLTLVYVVMGCLFFVFIVMGIRSSVLLKSLALEVDEEKENIEKLLSFIKAKKEEGVYKKPSIENYETDYLELSEKVVSDLSIEFPDMEPGFAFYVVDRFAGDIIDED